MLQIDLSPVSNEFGQRETISLGHFQPPFLTSSDYLAPSVPLVDSFNSIAVTPMPKRKKTEEGTATYQQVLAFL